MRPSELQQEPQTPTSSIATSSSSPTDTGSNTAATAPVFQDLKEEEEGVGLNANGLPRFPQRKDFPGLPLQIVKGVIDEEVRNCVILMYNNSKAKPSLHELALRLQKEQRDSVFLLLGALQGGSNDNIGKTLLDVINNLIARLGFLHRNIIILGHRQGGSDALAAVALREKIEFGGVISIGGAMPALTPPKSIKKAKTPALILSGELGGIKESDIQQIKERFAYVESDIRRTSNDDIPEAEDIGILLDFFAHRLRDEEWTKQAVISLGKLLHHVSDAALT